MRRRVSKTPWMTPLQITVFCLTPAKAHPVNKNDSEAFPADEGLVSYLLQAGADF